MKKIKPFLLVLCGLIFFAPMIINAQTNDNRYKFGVGVQWNYYQGGVAGQMMLTDEIDVQAVLGIFSGNIGLEGRGLYRFKQEDFWNLYGHAGLGFYNDKWLDEVENTIGFGAGVGFEYDWRALSDKLPPIYANFELSLVYLEFEHFNHSGIQFGGGFMYKFNSFK